MLHGIIGNGWILQDDGGGSPPAGLGYWHGNYWATNYWHGNYWFVT